MNCRQSDNHSQPRATGRRGGGRWLRPALAMLFGATLPLAAAQQPPEKTDAQLRAELLEQIEQARALRQRQEQMQSARQHLQAKAYAAAAEQFEALLAEKPEAGLYLDLGQARIGLQEYGPARGALLHALDMEPTLAPAQRGLGWLAFREKEYAEALRRWEPLMQNGQRDAELLERAGQCYYFTQQRRAALACLDAAALGRPADRDLDRWRIFCAQDIGEFETADRMARAYLAARPDDPEVRRIAAHCAAALQRGEDAILQLERLRLAAQLTPPDWTLLSDLYALAGNAEQAADCLEAAFPPQPTGGGRARWTGREWLKLAQAQERAGRDDRATGYYGNIAGDSPEFPAAQLGLARIAQSRRQPEATLKFCRAAVAQRPDLGEAHLLMATALEQTNRAAEAAAEYETAAATPACAADAYLGLARIAYLGNHLSAALRYYQAAAELRPDDRGLATIIVQLQQHLQAAADRP